MSGGRIDIDRLMGSVVLTVVVAVAVPVALLGGIHTLVVLPLAAVRGTEPAEVATDPVVIAASVLITASLGLLLWAYDREERRRRKEVAAWAALHGWQVMRRTVLVLGRWSAAPFAGSAKRRVLDAIRRVEARGTVVSLTHRAATDLHAVFTERPMRGPGVLLTPETAADRAARAVGAQDIQVESAELNARFRIQAPDGRFAHAVLHPRVMERLLEPDAAGLGVLVEGRDVVVFAPGRADLGRVHAMTNLVLDLADLLPAFVADDHPPLPPGTTRRHLRDGTVGRP